MQKIISILMIIIMLGLGLYFLKPSAFEKKTESKPQAETETKSNPLINLAIQATEPRLLDSLNRTSADLIKKVRPSVVKIFRRGENSYGLGVAIAPNGLILTSAKNLPRNQVIEVVLETGAAAQARWFASHLTSGLTFLKLENNVPIPNIEFNESSQISEQVMLLGRDVNLDADVVQYATVNGKMKNRSLIIYASRNIENVFVFNVQGQFLGIGEQKSGEIVVPVSQISAALKQF